VEENTCKCINPISIAIGAAAFIVFAVLAANTNMYVVLGVAYAATLGWLIFERRQSKKDGERPKKPIRMAMACWFVIATTFVAIFWGITALIFMLFGS